MSRGLKLEDIIKAVGEIDGNLGFCHISEESINDLLWYDYPNISCIFNKWEGYYHFKVRITIKKVIGWFKQLRWKLFPYHIISQKEYELLCGGD